MTRTRRRPLPAHQVEPERAMVFGLVLGVVSVVADGVLRQPDRGVPDAARDRVLRRRLHDLAEALDAAEHRHRRCRRGPPAGHRLGRGHGQRRHPGAAALRARLLLDAAALLGAVAADPQGLRRGRRADAPRREGDPRDDPPDRPLHGPHGRDLARAVGGRADGRHLPRRGGRPRRDLPVAGLPAVAARLVRGGLDGRRDPRSTSTRSATCRCSSWRSRSTRWC